MAAAPPSDALLLARERGDAGHRRRPRRSRRSIEPLASITTRGPLGTDQFVLDVAFAAANVPVRPVTGSTPTGHSGDHFARYVRVGLLLRLPLAVVTSLGIDLLPGTGTSGVLVMR